MFFFISGDLKVFKQKKIQNVLNNLVNATQNDNNIQLDLNRLSPIENVLKGFVQDSYFSNLKLK